MFAPAFFVVMATANAAASCPATASKQHPLNFNFDPHFVSTHHQHLALSATATEPSVYNNKYALRRPLFPSRHKRSSTMDAASAEKNNTPNDFIIPLEPAKDTEKQQPTPFAFPENDIRFVGSDDEYEKGPWIRGFRVTAIWFQTWYCIYQIADPTELTDFGFIGQFQGCSLIFWWLFFFQGWNAVFRRLLGLVPRLRLPTRMSALLTVAYLAHRGGDREDAVELLRRSIVTKAYGFGRGRNHESENKNMDFQQLVP